MLAELRYLQKPPIECMDALKFPIFSLVLLEERCGVRYKRRCLALAFPSTSEAVYNLLSHHTAGND